MSPVSSRHARDQRRVGRALGTFAPHNVAQWLLLPVVLLVFLGGVGTYAYVRLLAPDNIVTAGPDATHRWDGGKLVLHSGKTRRSAGCTIVPDDGPRRRMDVTPGPLGRTVLQPWFSGGADVTRCTYSTSVWTGWRAELAAVVLAHEAFVIYVVGLGILVVAYATVGPKTRRARAP